jgi:uncharacterized protein (TIGR03790 family)
MYPKTSAGAPGAPPSAWWISWPAGAERLPRMTALRYLLCAGIVWLSACSDPETTAVSRSALESRHLAVIVNDRDPHSRAVAEYYAARRLIPAANVIHISFDPGASVMPPAEFSRISAEVRARTPPAVQVLALAWTFPYRVGCMSITTAFAAGFDAAFCAASCKPTRASPYFDADSSRPFTDFGWRPAMLLAGTDIEAIRALIDRGIAADASRPPGSAYLVSTGDRQRNVRARFYTFAQMMQNKRFGTRIIQTGHLRYRPDVMFYFTGQVQVEGLDTLDFRPGAIADHLTSAGGKLDGSSQMSSLRWLEAGATASYGTVTEPCNYTQKFPRPDIVMERYLNGETLIEAYWKSVQWPGQGVFIGEPLARPFAD